MYEVATEGGATYRARRIALGTGTPPHIPETCRGLGGDLIHNSRYLPNKVELQKKRTITLIGSGQSAAEIYYDLLSEIDVHGYPLNWVIRSPRFFLLEYTKLTLEMTSPEYVDYFHALPERTRYRLETDGLILATGYKYSVPAFLEPVRDRIRWDGQGRFDVARDYAIDTTGRGIYLQNAGVHTHSITSPDLGMGAYRNARIIAAMLGREYYPVEKTIAFQEFAV